MIRRPLDRPASIRTPAPDGSMQTVSIDRELVEGLDDEAATALILKLLAGQPDRRHPLGNPRTRYHPTLGRIWIDIDYHVSGNVAIKTSRPPYSRPRSRRSRTS